MSYSPQFPEEAALVNEVYGVFNTHKTLLIEKLPQDRMPNVAMMLEGAAGDLSRATRDTNVDASNLIKCFVAEYNTMPNGTDKALLAPVVKGLQEAFANEAKRNPQALTQPPSKNCMMSLLISDKEVMNLLGNNRQVG